MSFARKNKKFYSSLIHLIYRLSFIAHLLRAI